MEELISKHAAIDVLEKEKPVPFVNKDGSIDPFGAGRQNQWYRDGIAIMRVPSVPSERKKGKWIEDGIWTDMYTADEIPVFKCSVCGNEVIGKSGFYYCPKCGAYMVEEKGE